MGSNFPTHFKKGLVTAHLEKTNMLSNLTTPAEIQLIEETKAYKKSIKPMQGSRRRQHAHIMDVGVSQAHTLLEMALDLGRQHSQPMKILDIGTFCGHSAGAMARGMAENGGKVITCDITEEYKPIAEKYWKAEGVLGNIHPHIIPQDKGGAHKLMDDLTRNPDELGTYDMIFIDAEKTGYPDYLKKGMALIRPGGKIVLDNMLWSGHVADLKKFPDAETKVLHDLAIESMKYPGFTARLTDEADGLLILTRQGFAGKMVRE